MSVRIEECNVPNYIYFYAVKYTRETGASDAEYFKRRLRSRHHLI